MILHQCKLIFPTAELTLWRPEIWWKPSSLAVTWGGPFGRGKIAFWTRLHNEFSHKTPVVFVDIPYLIGCRDACDSWNGALFGELSWHLKVPWDLISAKRKCRCRLRVEQLLLGLFVLKTMTVWFSVSIDCIFQLRSWHFGGQKFRGNHPVWLSRGGAPFGGEKIAFSNTFTQWIFSLILSRSSFEKPLSEYIYIYMPNREYT